MKGHTELPWHYRVSGDGYVIRSKSSPGAIAGINGIRPVDEAEANAQLIVTAVNTYPVVKDLVDALELAVIALEDGPARRLARSALAKFNALSAEPDQ